MTNKHALFLSLGSNISPEENIPRAIELLQKHSTIEAISSTWETPALGSRGPNFLNLALLIHCQLPHEEFKSQVIRKIEAELGRIRSNDKNAPRTIDIDILIADGIIIDNQIWERAHLAVPLAELDREISDPGSGLQIGSVAENLRANRPIKQHSGLTNKIKQRFR